MSVENIITYVKPELIVVAIVLYIIGVGLKKTESVKDNYIPVIIGAVGIILCSTYVFATSTVTTPQDVALSIFTSIVQGVLVAGLSTYVHQIHKQSAKEE